MLGGVPSLIGAASVRDSAARERSNFALVAIRVLSAPALRALGRSYGIANLRAVPDSSEGIALRRPGGAISRIHLVWQPSRAGHIFFRQALPILLAIGTLTLLAFVAVALISIRIFTHFQAQEQRTRKAELHASHVRAAAAEETARAKSAFIANMSHELRTPLNAVIGFSDIIRSEMFGPIGIPKYREYLDAINDSGRHLLDIVNDILHLSKIDAGKHDMRLEPVALDQVVPECVRMVSTMAAEREVRVECQKGETPVTVLADRQALKQILLNILSNAVKFSPAGSAVTIDCYDANDTEHVLRIRDRGCGIPETTLKDIGKPFVQAEQSHSRTFQGTGLGLAICFRLAKLMHASIHIDSTEGVGTTVSLTLRKAADAEKPAFVAERSAA